MSNVDRPVGDSELAALEFELFVHPPTGAEAAECARRITAGQGSVADQLRCYLWLVPPMVDSQPDWTAVGPHVLALIKEAPYLRSLNTIGIVTPGTPEHAQVEAAWQAARTQSNLSAEALRRAFEFYYEFDIARAATLVDELMTIDPEFPTTRLHAGCLQLKGADLSIPGYTYSKAFEFLDAAQLPGSTRHVSPGLAATAAFEAALPKEADCLAREGLSAPGYGLDDQAHWGWTTLGRIAAACGDLIEAKRCLEASVVDCLSYGGPSLRLAQDLARAGERSAVALFLTRIQTRWMGRRERCAGWLTALEGGDLPSLLNPGR